MLYRWRETNEHTMSARRARVREIRIILCDVCEVCLPVTSVDSLLKYQFLLIAIVMVYGGRFRSRRQLAGLPILYGVCVRQSLCMLVRVTEARESARKSIGDTSTKRDIYNTECTTPHIHACNHPMFICLSCVPFSHRKCDRSVEAEIFGSYVMFNRI